jgi:hypothetical protein
MTVMYNRGIGDPPPFTVSIAGQSFVYHADPKGSPPNCYSWTANVSGGQPSYTYTWKKNGVTQQTGPSSTYQECFSWNGYAGGSYQFTLSVDVTDASNPTRNASSSRIITAYNSSGGVPWGASPDHADRQIPKTFSIQQNFPNPFNPETEIVFALPEPSLVRISVMDLLGREIAELANRSYAAGYQRVTWRGIDSKGNKVVSGIYFYRILANGQSGVQYRNVLKMALAK